MNGFGVACLAIAFYFTTFLSCSVFLSEPFCQASELRLRDVF